MNVIYAGMDIDIDGNIFLTVETYVKKRNDMFFTQNVGPSGDFVSNKYPEANS